MIFVFASATTAVGRCGRQKKYWMDNIKEWASLPMPEPLTMASCRKRLEENLLLNRLSRTPDDPIGQWTDLN